MLLLLLLLLPPAAPPSAIFEAVGAAPDGFYTAAAAADVAFQYAKQEQLDAMAHDNKTLVLDAQLCDALYKGLIKKGELYPTHIAKVTDTPEPADDGSVLAAHQPLTTLADRLLLWHLTACPSQCDVSTCSPDKNSGWGVPLRAAADIIVPSNISVATGGGRGCCCPGTAAAPLVVYLYSCVLLCTACNVLLALCLTCVMSG